MANRVLIGSSVQYDRRRDGGVDDRSKVKEGKGEVESSEGTKCGCGLARVAPSIQEYQAAIIFLGACKQ